MALKVSDYRKWWIDVSWETGRTHYDGCEQDHSTCAISKLCARIEELEAERDNIMDQLQGQVAHTRAMLRRINGSENE